MDALEFLQTGVPTWPAKTLIYLDPPYYAKGRELYYDFYQRDDHEALATFVIGKLVRQRWIVSYDSTPAVRALYGGCQRFTYRLGYSARDWREGTEVIFLSDLLRACPLIGPFKMIRGFGITKNKDDLRSAEQARPRLEVALSGIRSVGRKRKTKGAANQSFLDHRAKKKSKRA